MSWKAYYETATGRLVSVGSVDPPELPAGVSAANLAGPPNLDTTMWDNATRTFITRPPKVFVDRLVDIQTHPDFTDWQAVWGALNAQRRAQVLTALGRLLGTARYRGQQEQVYPVH